MGREVTLAALKPGQSGKVLSLTGDAAVKKRISEMGLTKGVVVLVERIAPLGDPMDIKVRGYRLSLRKDEAARVEVDLVEKA